MKTFLVELVQLSLYGKAKQKALCRLQEIFATSPISRETKTNAVASEMTGFAYRFANNDAIHEKRPWMKLHTAFV